MKIYALLFFIGLSFSTSAQKLITATSQAWVGGVCCVSGINYTVQFELNAVEGKFELLELWHADHGKMDIQIESSAIHANKSRLNLRFSFTQREKSKLDLLFVEDQNATRPIKRKEFDGQVLIIYKLGSIEKQFIINEFTVLRMLAYP